MLHLDTPGRCFQGKVGAHQAVCEGVCRYIRVRVSLCVCVWSSTSSLEGSDIRPPGCHGRSRVLMVAVLLRHSYLSHQAGWRDGNQPEIHERRKIQSSRKARYRK